MTRSSTAIPGCCWWWRSFPGVTLLRLRSGIDEALEALKPGLPEVEIDAHIFRPATFIEQAIDNLSWALLSGCILVIVVLIRLSL